MTCHRLEDKVADAEKQYIAMQKKIVKCTEELNKRIFEHDQAIGEGFENKDLLVQVHYALIFHNFDIFAASS